MHDAHNRTTSGLATLLRYGVAVVAVAVAAAARSLTVGLTGDLAAFAPFFGAILLTALVAGRGPALLAVSLSTAVAGIWFQPHGSFLNTEHSFALLIFLLIATCVAVTVASVRSSRLRLASLASELTRHVAEAREDHDRLGRVLSSITKGYILLDERLRIIDSGGVARELLLGDRAEVDLLGRTIADLGALGVPSEFAEACRRALTDRTPAHLEIRNVAADRWCEIHIHPRDHGRLDVLLRDITDRKRAEESLADAAQRLQLALGAGRMAAWDWSIPEGAVTWSDGHAALLGRDAGRTTSPDAILDGVHPEDRPALESAVQAALRDRSELRAEFRIVHPDGTEHWMESRAQAHYDAEGRPERMFGVVINIDDRKRAAEALAGYSQRLEREVEARTAELRRSHDQLRIAERMAAIGTLSAGLGHDMGNLLLPARIRLESLTRQALPDDARADVEAIGASIEYLQKLTRGLRLFALDPAESSTAERTDLHPWWGEVQPFFRNALPRAVELRADFPPDLPPVHIARHTLTQAVYNLVQNAGDALADRSAGTVTVSAALDDAGRILLRVSDDGPGMTDDVRRQCMDLFFSTKTRGISTGMGLPLVHFIVQRVGGAIDIESAPGAGCTFTLTLPAAPPPAPGRPEAELERAAVSIGDARRRGLITMLLRMLQTAPETSNGLPADGVQLWVLDSDAHGFDRAVEFTLADPHRRAVVIGCEPMQDNGRIICLEPDAGPAAIREALRTAIERRPIESP